MPYIIRFAYCRCRICRRLGGDHIGGQIETRVIKQIFVNLLAHRFLRLLLGAVGQQFAKLFAKFGFILNAEHVEKLLIKRGGLEPLDILYGNFDIDFFAAIFFIMECLCDFDGCCLYIALLCACEKVAEFFNRNAAVQNRSAARKLSMLSCRSSSAASSVLNCTSATI